MKAKNPVKKSSLSRFLSAWPGLTIKCTEDGFMTFEYHHDFLTEENANETVHILKRDFLFIGAHVCDVRVNPTIIQGHLWL